MAQITKMERRSPMDHISRLCFQALVKSHSILPPRDRTTFPATRRLEAARKTPQHCLARCAEGLGSHLRLLLPHLLRLRAQQRARPWHANTSWLPQWSGDGSGLFRHLGLRRQRSYPEVVKKTPAATQFPSSRSRFVHVPTVVSAIRFSWCCQLR